jgi:hypothetical protein
VGRNRIFLTPKACITNIFEHSASGIRNGAALGVSTDIYLSKLIPVLGNFDGRGKRLLNCRAGDIRLQRLKAKKKNQCLTQTILCIHTYQTL